MIKFTLMLGLLVAFLQGCQFSSEQNKKLSSSFTPNSLNGGVGQGNGLIVYSNDVIGVNFSYPESWSLTESSDRKKLNLSNSKTSSGQTNISSIDFSTESLLDGTRIKSFEELEAYVHEHFPTSNWKKIQILNKDALVAKETTEDNERANYYVFDEKDQHILIIRYCAWPDFNGRSIINAIVASLLIDDEAPHLVSIKFSPSSAKQGETVKILVEAYDSLSGIDVEGFSKTQSPYPKYPPLLGYLIPEPTFSPSISFLSQEFKVLRPFKFVGNNTYESSFTIAPNAPLGDLVLSGIALRDYSGNEVTYKLNRENAPYMIGFVEETDDYFRISSDYFDDRWTLEKSNVKKAQLKILASGHPSSIEDKKGPELVDAYFDKSMVIVKKDSTINLFVELKDESEIEENLFLLEQSCFNNKNSYSPDYSGMLWDLQVGNLFYNFVRPIKIGPQKYKIQLDASSCTGNYASLKSMIVFDKANNKSQIIFRGTQDFPGAQIVDKFLRFQIK